MVFGEPADPRPLVWVVDGAGDLRGCSTALAQANLRAGAPLELSPFVWAHRHRRFRLELLLDQIDWPHARAQGTRLAAAILERKEQEPNRRVVLVAHSAGCAVALAACTDLPPDTVDRTILLAPSVSTGYDLRPALWAAKEGLDVFCSRKDWVALGFVIRVVGTTDTRSSAAAGRFGFHPRGQAASDPATSTKLRQHFWSADQVWTGHTGGHHGMHTPAFIHAYLFPLIEAPVK
jgi:pimeloyl-ACP methyl ester carboxylesterase